MHHGSVESPLNATTSRGIVIVEQRHQPTKDPISDVDAHVRTSEAVTAAGRVAAATIATKAAAATRKRRAEPAMTMKRRVTKNGTRHTGGGDGDRQGVYGELAVVGQKRGKRRWLQASERG